MSQQPAFIKRSSFNEKNVLVSAKEVKQDVNRSKQTTGKELVDDFEKNCKNHLENENLIFACCTCKKFVCTRCYCKSHRDCYCNLVDLMYTDIKSDNESNLKLLLEMKEDFSSHLKFMEEKNEFIEKNNPFESSLNLINKIYDDIINSINKSRMKAIENMNSFKDSYMKNIHNNIEKIRDVIVRSEDAEKGLKDEIKKMSKQNSFDFCKDYILCGKSDELADQCEEIKVFADQDFNRIKQSFIDTNTIIFNDSTILIDQCKNFREYLGDKIVNFYNNYSKYAKKYAYTVVMNKREFIVYLIENNRVNVVNYTNDFIIPSYARWIEISGDKLLLTGGEKDYIESLNTTYMFKFNNYDVYNQNGFQAKVMQKSDMLYKRRAHNLIYFNDYIYAVSGVDKLEMIKTCEKYDIYNDKWIEVPGLNYPRQNAALAVHNQRYLYAFSGYDGFKNVDSFEKLDSLNEAKGWTIMEIKNSLKDCDVVDIKKNRMGVIPLDFDTILIFGGERNSKEYKDAYIYEFFEDKFYKFTDLVKNSNFIMTPIFYAGKYILFDFLNNIHELNLETLMFEYHVFNKDVELMNL